MPLLISQEIDSRVEKLSSRRQLVICLIVLFIIPKKYLIVSYILISFNKKAKCTSVPQGFASGSSSRLSQTVKIWSIHSLFIEESEMFQEQIQAILLQRLC